MSKLLIIDGVDESSNGEEQELSSIVNSVYTKYRGEHASARTLSLIECEIMNRINVSKLRGSLITPKIHRVKCKYDNNTGEMHVMFFKSEDFNVSAEDKITT